MDSINRFISNINKDLNIISYKIDNTIPDGYMSIVYLLTLLFIFIICLYNQPFWSYILLLLLILIFLTIYTNRDFTRVNIMKIVLNFTIKPICLFILIIVKSGIIDLVKAILPEDLIYFLLFVALFLFICFIIFKIFDNKIRCKYDLNKIKDKNINKWDGINLPKEDNECNKLDLGTCYALEELQPCLKQLSDKNDCNYCLDYSYSTESVKCAGKKEEEECNEENNCFWDNEQCKNELDDSKRLCIDYHKDDNDNYDEKSIKCKNKDYCSKELDTKYCHQMPDFDSYKTAYIILYLVALFIIVIYYRLDCISDKSFVLIILIVNILCLGLFIFLQNIAVSDETVAISDKTRTPTGSTDNVEYS